MQALVQFSLWSSLIKSLSIGGTTEFLDSSGDKTPLILLSFLVHDVIFGACQYFIWKLLDIKCLKTALNVLALSKPVLNFKYIKFMI